MNPHRLHGELEEPPETNHSQALPPTSKAGITPPGMNTQPRLSRNTVIDEPESPPPPNPPTPVTARMNFVMPQSSHSAELASRT